MPYFIRTFIEIEIENSQIYKSIEEAEEEKNHLEAFQPENIYIIEEITDA